MSATVWQKCLGLLQEEYPAQQFNTWLRPLQAETVDSTLMLLAPNRFVVDWVQKNFYPRIVELVGQISADEIKVVSIEIGSKVVVPVVSNTPTADDKHVVTQAKTSPKKTADHYKNSYLNKKFVFDSFVRGKSNDLASAAAFQVGECPGDAYNPLFIWWRWARENTSHACRWQRHFEKQPRSKSPLPAFGTFCGRHGSCLANEFNE